MGSSSSKHIDVTNFDLQEWQQLGIHRQTSKIVQSFNGKGIAQLQTIPFDPKRDIQNQINIYQYRKTSTSPLVRCLGVVQQEVKSSSICGDSHVLKVLTERIPLRLNQLPQLSFPQTLYTLSESLRGYKDCYNKVGPFDVYDQMIGVNQQGDVKIWVNQNFAQNHPQIEKPLLQTSGSQIHENNQFRVGKNSQTQMVENIFKTIEKKNEFGRYPEDFSSKIYNQNLTFDEAFKEIELFSKEKNIIVPESLNLPSSKNGYLQPDMQSTMNRSSINTAINPQHQLFSESNGHSERLFSPIIYKQSQRRSVIDEKNSFRPSQITKLASPTKMLYQQTNEIKQIQSPQRLPLNSPVQSMTSPQRQAVGNKVIFRFVSPETAMLSPQRSQLVNRM